MAEETRPSLISAPLGLSVREGRGGSKRPTRARGEERQVGPTARPALAKAEASPPPDATRAGQLCAPLMLSGKELRIAGGSNSHELRVMRATSKLDNNRKTRPSNW